MGLIDNYAGDLLLCVRFAEMCCVVLPEQAFRCHVKKAKSGVCEL